MATLDATLAELKSITKALADHAIGTARSPAHSAHGALARLAPPDDFVPAQTNAESYAAELVRHKGMLGKPWPLEPLRSLTPLPPPPLRVMASCAHQTLVHYPRSGPLPPSERARCVDNM